MDDNKLNGIIGRFQQELANMQLRAFVAEAEVERLNAATAAEEVGKSDTDAA